MTLIKSISGIRGTIGGKVGDNLTPIDVVKFASAYGVWVKQQRNKKDYRVVVGRDARISGEMVPKSARTERLVIGVPSAGHFTYLTTPNTKKTSSIIMEEVLGVLLFSQPDSFPSQAVGLAYWMARSQLYSPSFIASRLQPTIRDNRETNSRPS